MGYRITVDVGGTFTDVVVVGAEGELLIGKAPTTPERAFTGVRDALENAAASLGVAAPDVLAGTDLFVYSTTRATNAVLERTTAKTALLTTEGFPDVLVLREGGKSNPFDLDVPYPEPYVPRRLTFEVPGRIDAEGGVVTPLDEAAVRRIARRLAGLGVEAVAVCLLWSVANAAHELRVGEILAAELPDVAVTLSHRLNPVVREYRRASATALDASLKPLMGAHLSAVADDLAAAGFTGELVAATSYGGIMHIPDLAERPIFSVKSGPALAPVAGRTYAEAELSAGDVVVCDMGGTSFDVSLVRDGAINFTRETWLGERFLGHLVATSSVDVRSVGAGGGSIAWVDDGGLLRVGPQSAGARPGPACYGRGGTRPTVTDAAVVLGYLSPAHFLGGRMTLDADAAWKVVGELGERLGLDPHRAADAVLAVASEVMVGAIGDITVNEGLDPRESVFVAGGAAGLTIGRIVAELGCGRVLVPRTAGALSAVGGQYSDIVAEFTGSRPMTTAAFDHDGVNAVLDELNARADAFAARLAGRGIRDTRRDLFVDARYAFQVWDIELPVPSARFDGPQDVKALSAAFDAEHERIFAVAEPGQTVETLTWRLRLTAPVGDDRRPRMAAPAGSGETAGETAAESAQAYFPGHGLVTTPIHTGSDLPGGTVLTGPAIIADRTSTLVVQPEWTVTVTGDGNYLMESTR
jgi:N-methylhydantoinase A